jgi:hypothetical protein
MNERVRFQLRLIVILGLVMLATCKPFNSLAQQTPGATTKDTASNATAHDGQHDFDFNFGVWRTHIRRLQKPLSGSGTWTTMEGTVTVLKIWDGQGQVEDIEADGQNGHWSGLTVFLYNPQSHQWSQTFAGKSDGTLQPPIIGEFKNGRGELFGQDSFNGRSILVRGVWSGIAANAHKFEQSFSADGGKTWEVNFIGTLERISQ